jgi:DNA-binding transcriptional ArsR family regulator
MQTLIPLAALFANALSAILIFRLRLAPLLKAVYGGFAAGLAALCLMQAFFAPGFGDLAANAVIYGALSYCHFHFINLGETARRIRILRELAESPDGLSREELSGRYNARQMLSVRLARLEGNGQLRLENGRYVSGAPAVLGMARALDFMKRLLLGRKAG